MVDFSWDTVKCRETLPVALTKGCHLKGIFVLQYTQFLNVQEKASIEDTLLLRHGESDQYWYSLKVLSWTKTDFSNGLQFTVAASKATLSYLD